MRPPVATVRSSCFTRIAVPFNPCVGLESRSIKLLRVVAVAVVGGKIKRRANYIADILCLYWLMDSIFGVVVAISGMHQEGTVSTERLAEKREWKKRATDHIEAAMKHASFPFLSTSPLKKDSGFIVNWKESSITAIVTAFLLSVAQSLSV